MSQKKEVESQRKSNDYGLYLTRNTYDGYWYCFNRDNAPAYWNGEPCDYSKGKTPNQALKMYHDEH